MRFVFLQAVLLVITGGATFAQSSFPFVEINEISSSIVKEIRYAGNHNFVGTEVNGYAQPKCYLTKNAAEALARVQEKLAEQSYSLKVFDCYRPQQAVDHFVKWAKSKEVDQTKHIYFPRVDGGALFEEGYIAERSGHSRGSTVDLTIIRLPYLPPSSFDYNCTRNDGNQYRGSELDMGTAFDCFDVKSHTFSELVSEEVIANRTLLVKIMEEEGFVNYSKEWWHFTFKPEEFPDTYFDLSID